MLNTIGTALVATVDFQYIDELIMSLVGIYCVWCIGLYMYQENIHIIRSMFSITYSSDMDDCAQKPCLNDGICEDTGLNSYSCKCVPGFTGDHCETS